MRLKNLQKNKGAGFVMLFAITISAIVLAIALGVANIAFKEIKFGSDARDTNDAFFAVDTGIESALFGDKPPNHICTVVPPATSCSFSFAISQLGSLGQSCVNVIVNKTTSPPIITITATGYNTGGNIAGSCNPPQNSMERQFTVTY